MAQKWLGRSVPWKHAEGMVGLVPQSETEIYVLVDSDGTPVYSREFQLQAADFSTGLALVRVDPRRRSLPKGWRAVSSMYWRQAFEVMKGRKPTDAEAF